LISSIPDAHAGHTHCIKAIAGKVVKSSSVHLINFCGGGQLIAFKSATVLILDRCAASKNTNRPMNELLLNGPVSDQEVAELNQDLEGVEVLKYQTKGLSTSEVIQLVFHNLDIVTFTRDYLLATSLNAIIGQIKYAVSYFSRKNKKVKYVNLEVQIKNNDKEFLLYLSSDSERIDTAISLTDNKMKVIIDSASNGETIQVKLDTNATDIEISKI
jgi:hypothetical protein